MHLDLRRSFPFAGLVLACLTLTAHAAEPCPRPLSWDDALALPDDGERAPKRSEVEALLGPADQVDCEDNAEEGPTCTLRYERLGASLGFEGRGKNAPLVQRNPKALACFAWEQSDGEEQCPLVEGPPLKVDPGVFDRDASKLCIGTSCVPLPPTKVVTGAGELEAFDALRFGDRWLVSYTDCAGPCGQGQLHDATGKPLAKRFKFGNTRRHVAVLGDVLAVASDEGELTIVARSSGKVKATYKRRGLEAGSSAVAAVGANELVFLWKGDEDERVHATWFTYDGRKLKRRIERVVPTCQ